MSFAQCTLKIRLSTGALAVSICAQANGVIARSSDVLTVRCNISPLGSDGTSVNAMAHAIMRTMAIRNHNGDFFSLKNASHFGCQNRKIRRWSAGLIASIC
jgi:hypothetical protein